MTEIDFKAAFEQLTGNRPFPWQEKLYELFINSPDSIPKRCDIPTGLGKTSVIAIWLLAREKCPSLPRRLVYVVNRRTVVDQTTNEVERYKRHRPELAVSTLRGQFADNREWSADPSRTAVICGTVDMIGSRLLFSGYGVGFKGKPLHAGFLGQDSLIVHDEAHLEPAFQDLLNAIEKEQHEGRFPDKYPVRVMELSATSQSKHDVPKEAEPFTLTPADRQHDIVKKRIYASKTLNLHAIDDEKKLADKLAELALAHKDSGRAIIVFVRTVDDLEKVVAKLPEEQTRQLTGTMRGRERDNLINDTIFKRFLPNADPADKTIFLVCTSAGEVGVNISADHLVCDLSTFESMAQRFGRVNRFGLRDDTRIDVVHPILSAFDEKNKLTTARQKTLDLLKELNSNASPDALTKLNEAVRAEAFAPKPVTVPTSDILFDAWAMTSILGQMPGRPKVEPFLHGISDWEPPQTKIAWRLEVAEVIGEYLIAEYPPKDLLEAYPIKPLELLTDRSDRIFTKLKKLGSVVDVPVWLVDDDGRVEVSTLAEIIADDKESIEGLTLLLPPHAGGLKNGFFNPSAKYDKDNTTSYDVADEWTGPGRIPMRSRSWQKPEEDDQRTPSGMKKVFEIEFSDSLEDDTEPTKIWHWFVRLSTTDADTWSRTSYDLQPHLDDAKREAMQFVVGLSLEAELRAVVVLAATFHDLGKDRRRWQNGIGNHDYPNTKWAKSGKRQAVRKRSAYRHEFGSMLDIQSLPAFKALSDDSRELILHLIAAHHGRARPHFTPDECLDENHRGEPGKQQSIEVLRRFARLQRKFGRWGLAYLESLVRAADYAASEFADEQSVGGAR